MHNKSLLNTVFIKGEIKKKREKYIYEPDTKFFCNCFSGELVFTSFAQNDVKNKFNPINTGVTSLGIAPDARGGSMGDLGAATDPDVNSQYWNPAKYAFAFSRAGVSVSYTPWLRKLVNDINLAYVAGYWKFGSSDLQALSASLRYFSLGSINTYR